MNELLVILSVWLIGWLIGWIIAYYIIRWDLRRDYPDEWGWIGIKIALFIASASWVIVIAYPLKWLYSQIFRLLSKTKPPKWL